MNCVLLIAIIVILYVLYINNWLNAETFEPIIASRSYPSSNRSLPSFYTVNKGARY